ncbi:MAG: carboxypeptidase regulatory-like domain-containing protein [Deltaproteobacteria bacterium]|nr:carboxypeptidase regulatory-like domain-containing protein [Deltaproteobacteria bacterium]
MKKEIYLKLKFFLFLLLVPFITPVAGFVYFNSENFTQMVKEKIIKSFSGRTIHENSISQSSFLENDPILVERVQSLEKFKEKKEEISIRNLSIATAKDLALDDNIRMTDVNLEKIKTRDNNSLQNSPWSLTGQILHYNKEKQTGHYEVFYYDAVGSDGLPTPESRILKHVLIPRGESFFQITFDKPVKGHLMARYYDGSSDIKLIRDRFHDIAVYENNPILADQNQDSIYLVMNAHRASSYSLTGQVLMHHPSIKPYSDPKPNIIVQLEGTDIELKTNEEGFFYLDNLFHYDGYLRIIENNKILKRVPLYLNSSIAFEISTNDIHSSSSLSGIIFNNQGKALQNASVSIQENPFLRTITDDEGRFSLDGLKSGSWTLEVLHNQMWMGYMRVSHIEGLSTEVFLQQKEPVMIRGQVLQASLLHKLRSLIPIVQAHIKVVGYPWETTSNEEGQFVLDNIPSFRDDIEIELLHPDYEPTTMKYSTNLDFAYMPKLLKSASLPYSVNTSRGKLLVDFSYFSSFISLQPPDSNLLIELMPTNKAVQIVWNLREQEQQFVFYSEEGTFRGLSRLNTPNGYTSILLP